MISKWAVRSILTILTLLVLIQLVPYGRDHTNPPITAEPAWPSSEVRALAVRACFDCHSNETRWPWYSHVAPISWLVQSDTMEGRREVNYSEWDRAQKEAGESAEVVTNGEMPPAIYLPTHPDARLTKQEQATLAAGLQAVVGRKD